VVVMPLELSVSPNLLRRRLLYTAISRAQQLLVIVGTQEALDACVRNNAEVSFERLVRKLQAAAAQKGVKPFPRLMFGEQGWEEQKPAAAAAAAAAAAGHWRPAGHVAASNAAGRPRPVRPLRRLPV
jgi:ATP-dependent exoDNAse (exonuclease V) alpha subunit